MSDKNKSGEDTLIMRHEIVHASPQVNDENVEDEDTGVFNRSQIDLEDEDTGVFYRSQLKLDEVTLKKSTISKKKLEKIILVSLASYFAVCFTIWWFYAN